MKIVLSLAHQLAVEAVQFQPIKMNAQILHVKLELKRFILWMKKLMK